MKRINRAALCLALLLAIAGCSTSPADCFPSPETVVEQPAISLEVMPDPHATILIGHLPHRGQIEPAGSGVVFHSCPEHGTLALTCEHVIRKQRDYYGKFKHGDFRIEVFHKFQLVDLAIVRLPGHYPHVVTVGWQYLPFPFGMNSIRIRKKQVPYVPEGKVWHRSWQTVFSDEAVISGDSGSGIYYQDKLVGIVKAQSKMNPHVVLIIPISIIRNYLKPFLKCQKQFPPETP
jgi:hypothetical protein